jgi:hypothetical protein
VLAVTVCFETNVNVNTTHTEDVLADTVCYQQMPMFSESFCLKLQPPAVQKTDTGYSPLTGLFQ